MSKSRKPKAGVSPVVATIILIAIFVVVVSAALGFTQTELTSYYAQSDLSQAQSFTSTLAQAINSVAFTFGRSLSVGYGFKYARLAYIPNAIQYTVTMQTSSGLKTFSVTTGILVVVVSAHFYSLGKNYQQRIYPQTFTGLVSLGGSGSYTLAYSKEYFTSGQAYIYTVVAPIPLAVNTTATIQTSSGIQTQHITKIYLTQLVPGSRQPQPPQSCSPATPNVGVVAYNLTSGYISAQGAGYVSCAVANVAYIKVSVSYPNQQYPSTFFVFPSSPQTLDSSGFQWQVQLYVGSVVLGGD